MNLQFRAYDPVTDTFIYSKDVAGGMWRFFKLLEDRGIRHFEAEPYIWLDDIDDKEIYVGDLIQLNNFGNKDLKREVYYDTRSSSYRMRVNGEMQYDKTYDMMFATQGKIAGNIHQERTWNK